jgi:hypothetical protein
MMMTVIGQIKKKTKARVVTLFRDRRQYDYLGSLIDQENPNLLRLTPPWRSATLLFIPFQAWFKFTQLFT